jgi:hypothetical protein
MTFLHVAPGLLAALAVILAIWLLTGIFRRRRLPRLIGWLTLGWTLWHLRPAARPRSLPAILGLALIGVLAARLATLPGHAPRDPARRGW